MPSGGPPKRRRPRHYGGRIVRVWERRRPCWLGFWLKDQLRYELRKLRLPTERHVQDLRQRLTRHLRRESPGPTTVLVPTMASAPSPIYTVSTASMSGTTVTTCYKRPIPTATTSVVYTQPFQSDLLPIKNWQSSGVSYPSWKATRRHCYGIPKATLLRHIRNSNKVANGPEKVLGRNCHRFTSAAYFAVFWVPLRTCNSGCEKASLSNE